MRPPFSRTRVTTVASTVAGGQRRERAKEKCVSMQEGMKGTGESKKGGEEKAKTRR
jgi:hypothetical protein